MRVRIGTMTVKPKYLISLSIIFLVTHLFVTLPAVGGSGIIPCKKPGGCGAKAPDSDPVGFTYYEFSQASCSTGRHGYSGSLKDNKRSMCSDIQNEQLNGGCEPNPRKEFHRKYCH